MISTSTEFQTAASATVRKPKAKLDIIWTSQEEDSSITVTSTDGNRASNFDQISDGITDTIKKWAHLDGLIKADGGYKLMPDPYDSGILEQVGWYGSTRCNASATWTAGFPSLTMEFDARPVISLFVAGDNYWNEYPVDFTIELYAGLSLEYTETVTDNSLLRWSKEIVSEALTSITKMVLTITEWSTANKIVKISEFYTDFLQTMTGDEIVSMNLLEERVIGDGSLPVGNISSNELDLTLNNVAITVQGTEIIDPFFPNNTSSIFYELIRKNRRVEPYLGFDVLYERGFVTPDGTDDYVTTNCNPSASMTKTFAWFYNSASFANGIVFGNYTSGTVYEWLYHYNNTIRYMKRNAGDSDYQTVLSATTPVTDGAWHSIVVVIDLSQAVVASRCRMWFDGVEKTMLVSANPLDQTPYSSTNGYSLFARNSVTGYTDFLPTQDIKHVIYAEEAWDQTKINRFHAENIQAADTEMWLKCNDASGNLIDSSGNGNDGVPTNTDSTFYNPSYSVTEYVKMGVFWTGDWTVNEQDYTASVSCRDRMERLRKAEYKTSTLFENATLYDIAISVLNHAKANIPMPDLTWSIDTELQDYTIAYAWFPKQDYFKTIKQIVEACMGQAYMSKEDVLIIEGPGALTT